MIHSEQEEVFRGTVMVRQADKTLEPLPLRARYDNTDGGLTPCRYCDPHFAKIAREWPWEGRTHTSPDLLPRFRMVFHSKASGCISLPRCIRISMLELPTGPVLHGSVASIDGGHPCGLMRGFHRYAGYDPGFVRGDPSQGLLSSFF
jgi:hypothetical protein